MNASQMIQMRSFQRFMLGTKRLKRQQASKPTSRIPIILTALGLGLSGFVFYYNCLRIEHHLDAVILHWSVSKNGDIAAQVEFNNRGNQSETISDASLTLMGNVGLTLETSASEGKSAPFSAIVLEPKHSSTIVLHGKCPLKAADELTTESGLGPDTDTESWIKETRLEDVMLGVSIAYANPAGTLEHKLHLFGGTSSQDKFWAAMLSVGKWFSDSNQEISQDSMDVIPLVR